MHPVLRLYEDALSNARNVEFCLPPLPRFRVMILPRALLGKSSIRYVKDEDKDKPKTQTYKVYADAPLEFANRK